MQILEQHTCTQLLLEPEVRCLTAHHNTGRSRFPVLSRSNRDKRLSLESVWLKLPLHQSVAKLHRSGSKQKQTKENRVDWLRQNVHCEVSDCVWAAGDAFCRQNNWTVSMWTSQLGISVQPNFVKVYWFIYDGHNPGHVAICGTWTKMDASFPLYVTLRNTRPLLLDLWMTDIQMNVIMLNKWAKQLLCKWCQSNVSYTVAYKKRRKLPKRLK